MISHIAIFAVSLVVLAKGADLFVEYAGRIAKRFGVSDFIIGLTLTSIGTSVPELAASVSASLEGATGLVIGTVVGSNIARIGLILGVSAIIKSFSTEPKMYDRDGYVMLASVVLVFAFSLDNQISTLEAGIMLASYIFYLAFIIKSDRDNVYHFQDFMKYIFDFEYMGPVKRGFYQFGRKKSMDTGAEGATKKFNLALYKDLGLVILSGIAILISANYLVQEAIWLAASLDIPQSLVGISLVAIGTSLPELTVSISAARSGKGDMILGTILGSNIGNILLIIGTSGLIADLQIQEISVVYTIPIMIFFSIALLYFIKSDWSISRTQGIVAIIAYCIFMLMAFLMGWS